MPAAGLWVPTRFLAFPPAGIPIQHLLRRGDKASLLVDQDVWLCVLDLAVSHGWKPQGTVRGKDGSPRDPLLYSLPRGQQVLEADARELGRCVEVSLSAVSDSIVPMRGKPFGRSNTQSLIRQAVFERQVSAGCASAAAEILSGPPKAEAWRVVDFLKGGGFTLHPAPLSCGALKRRG